MVVKRNPLYRGSRPHHVNEFRVSFVDTAATGIARVARGQADWVDEGASSEYAGIRKKFKILKRQLFQVSGLSTRFVEMNNSRGLFRNNVKLRRAVNFAIDRPALVRARELVGTLTDQYLPPAIPGFRDARIYPLRRPDVRRAKGLARGHTRGGVAVLYAQDNPPNVAQAQVLTKDLARIGIHVETKTFPGPQLFARLFTPGEPWDLTLVGYGPDYPDPYAMLNTLFDGAILRANPEKSFNIARFDSPKYNRLLQRASRLAGRARVRAYGNLDVELARDAAPLAAYASETAFFFFSRRTGCVRFDPLFDLAAVCLRG
jgi:peptide/nickel transport system substrate-binding protein/oligopeptide transport system substrate-binding protein